MNLPTQIYRVDALEAALEAGRAILEVYRKPGIRKEVKADNTPVTEADRAAHRIIAQRLGNTDLPLLSEEGKQVDYEVRRKWETFWLVDPLDGTKEFLRKTGEFTVNIALIYGTSPVMGVIYAPLDDLMYFASEGGGAWKMENFSTKWGDFRSAPILEDIAVRLPLQGEERPYRVVASRSHRNLLTNRYIRKLEKSHPGLKTISRGSSLKFCLMAEGSADCYPRFGPTWEWDTAAGQAIAESVGCRVRMADRDASLTYNKTDLLNPGFIVSGINPPVG